MKRIVNKKGFVPKLKVSYCHRVYDYDVDKWLKLGWKEVARAEFNGGLRWEVLVEWEGENPKIPK